MATLCIVESRPPLQREVRSIAARRPRGLRDWLAGQWGLIFSHPEDFRDCGLEQDRWLVVLAQEFDAAGLRPLACPPGAAQPDASWASAVTGDHSLVPLEGAVADLAARQLCAQIGALQSRFVLIVDEQLRRRGLLSYRSGHGRLSPLDLVASVTMLRRRSMERCAA